MAGGREWTEEELMLVEEWIGLGRSDEAIGQRLGRTATAIQVIRKRRGIASRTRSLLSSQAVAQQLGVRCPKTVVRWLRLGWLQGRQGQRRGPHRQWFVTEEALLAFLQDPRGWPAWSPERISDPSLREWATEVRTERYLRLGEVARRFHVHEHTVWQWLERGELAAVRWGNWWIAESSLRGFVIPSERVREHPSPVRFSEHEDARLMVLRKRLGWSWPAIGADMGRHASVLCTRYRRLEGRARV